MVQAIGDHVGDDLRQRARIAVDLDFFIACDFYIDVGVLERRTQAQDDFVDVFTEIECAARLVKSKICCKFSSIQSMTNGFLAREGNNVVALSGGDSGSHPFGVFTHIQVSPFLPNFVFLGQ